jgi:hypothetical protein
MGFARFQGRRVAALALGISALGWSAATHAALSFDETNRLARERAPALQAQQHELAGAQAVQPSAGTLPDPRLTLA